MGKAAAQQQSEHNSKNNLRLAANAPGALGANNLRP